MFVGSILDPDWGQPLLIDHFSGVGGAVFWQAEKFELIWANWLQSTY